MSRNSLYVNGEGYVDNTAGKALRNIQRKRKEVGVNYKAQIIGRNSKKSGEKFEIWISTACKFYLNKGLAHIEKTPEPFHITGKDMNGVVRGYYEKKGQPDYKGILCDGTGIMLEAKHTDSDRIKQSVITDCYVMVSLGLRDFFRVPWSVWKNMKELFGHKYMNETELEDYRIRQSQCTILLLEGIELKNENTKDSVSTKAKSD